MDASTWEAALDELEAHLIRAEHMLQTMDPEEILNWQAPALGTMPRYLVPRAQALLERQQRVIERLPIALTGTRAQRQLADKVGHATTRSALPVYLDVTA